MERHKMATALEKKNLEAHVDLCQQRYEQLDGRLTKIEEKVEHIHHDITHGNKAMIKVLFGATATIVTGLLSTIIVVIMNLPT
jgi:tetrahydromethanopterin S-methyltransferase subunit G|tara:strand:- start:290 stop:538 length:249 start_codon:yes stop_codon:yes gene_type:complete